MMNSSLSLTNTRNGTFNSLSLVYDNNVKNVLDLFALKDDIANITGLQIGRAHV